jgi:hypothetical protein
MREETVASRKFRLGMPVMALVLGMSVIGCASHFATFGFMYGFKPIYTVNTVNIDTAPLKIGMLTKKVWFSYFGYATYPTISDTAKQAGISRIATVECYVKPGILGLWTEYTTIVRGK